MTHVDFPQSICRFAIAHGDITPPADIYHRMWGAAKHEQATGVHRPLRATVAAFAAAEESDDGGEQILIALDHCVLGVEEMNALLDAVSRQADVPRDRLLVVFSHTHAAGLMSLDRTELPGGDLIPGYLEDLHARIAALVTKARSNLGPSQIVYGQGRCDLARQRDFWDADREQYVCGFNPAGIADDTVLVARITDQNGSLLATMVNYACHPTTLAWDNTRISPDFPGAMREVVEKETGAPCLFLQGASADLGPFEGFVGDVEVADRNGRQLGYAALSALTALPVPGMRFEYQGPVVSGATLGSWAHAPLSSDAIQQAATWRLRRWQLPLTYRPELPTADQVAAELDHWQAEENKARTAGDEERAADARAMVERKNRNLRRALLLPPGDAFPLEIVLWRIGSGVWLGVQGEHYQVLQTALRERFPDAAIVVATIASDWGASYLPPRQVYGTGIYQETIAVVAPGSLEKVIEEIGQAVEQLCGAVD